MVQCCFTSTETVRLIKTESPGRPPRLILSFWILSRARSRKDLHRPAEPLATGAINETVHWPDVIYTYMVQTRIYSNQIEMDESELKSCAEVEVAVLDSPSLTNLMVYVGVKQHLKKKKKKKGRRNAWPCWSTETTYSLLGIGGGVGWGWGGGGCLWIARTKRSNPCEPVWPSGKALGW